MALSGQLSDLSLAELIEFFCNQRKSGRLRVSYPHAPGFFYFQKGTMVDAKIGALNGVEAVYFALTLENASFNFDASFQPTRRTIHQPWAQVALEGLRRMDEGIHPSEAFPNGYIDAYMDDVEGSSERELPEKDESKPLVPAAVLPRKHSPNNDVPLSFLVEPASGGRRRILVYGVIAAAVLIIVGAIGFPAGWYSRKQQPKVSQPSTVVSAELPPLTNNTVNNSPQPDGTGSGEASSSALDDAMGAGPVNDGAGLAAKRRREGRERWKAADEKPDGASAKPGATPASSTKPVDAVRKPDAAKPKTTTVQVSYDEAGRVTQASGGDANALRIARQKRFPPGKAGSATVTIPVN